MTVENTNSTISYTGNSSVTTFAYNFLTYSTEHLFIYFDDVLQTSGFTITGIGDDNGGDVTFVSPPITGVTIRIDRTVPDTQLLSYQDYGPFPPKANERGLDLLTMAVQQTSRNFNRGKMDKRPLADENNIIVFDDTGNSKDSGFPVFDGEAKMDRIPNASAGNFVTFDSAGNSANSGINTSSFFNKMDKAPTSNIDNVVIFDSAGNAKDSGKKLNEVGNGGSYIGENPPTFPQQGDRWTRCTDMKGFIYYVDADSAQWVEDRPSYGEDTFGDLSQAYIFETVADYQVSPIVFPVGKTIHLNDRDADFTVIAGTGGDGYGTISSSVTGQSISVILGMVINYRSFGVVGDAETANTDNSGAVNAAHAAGSSNWEIYQGEGVIGCSLITPKQRQIIQNTRFKHWGNGGSSSPINDSPVITLGDNVNEFDGFLMDNVHVDGNRAAFANINILGGADGGMHGIAIRGRVSGVTLRDGSCNFCGTAGIALDWDTDRETATDAPNYRISDINIVRYELNDNREHGSFAAYCQRLKYIDCNVRRNGIDLPGGPFTEEDGRHGAFISANGYFSRGIDIEGYDANSGFTKVEIRGGEYTNNANGAIQFLDPTALGTNRIGSAHCVIENVLTGPVTVGTSTNTINIQAGNPIAGQYGMNGMYINEITLQDPMRINGVSGLNITGYGLGTTDPQESIEIFNSRRISTSIPVTSELLLNDIEVPTVTVDSGVAAIPTIQSIDYEQPVCGVSRVTYKYKVTGGGGADGDNNRFKFVWVNGLPVNSKRQPSMYSVLHSTATVDPASYNPVPVEAPDGNIRAFVKGTTGNNDLIFYLTVNVIAGKEL